MSERRLQTAKDWLLAGPGSNWLSIFKVLALALVLLSGGNIVAHLWRGPILITGAVCVLALSCLIFVILIERRIPTKSYPQTGPLRSAKLARGMDADVYWVWDLTANAISFSNRWYEWVGSESIATLQRPDSWFVRVHPGDLRDVQQALSTHLGGLTDRFLSEHRLHVGNGQYRWVQATGKAERDADGQVIRIEGTFKIVPAAQLGSLDSVSSSLHDPLTGLPNRSLFMGRLRMAIARLWRQDESCFAVLFLDLDRFKLINDSLGHMMGDQLLIEVARRMKHHLKPSDTVARFGGDEFAILLEDIEGVAEATSITDRILHQFVSSVEIAGRKLFTGASIGVVMGTSAYNEPEDVMRDADIAMHRAKDQGLSRFEVFDPSMHIQAVTALQVETDLRQAVRQEDFELVYQPIVRLNNDRIIGFEALIRWRHPIRGLLKPEQFIPLAEETDMIHGIGRWVLDRAAQQMAIWQDAYVLDPGLTMSVNLSGKQLKEPDLIARVKEVLLETNLTPDSLILEITESTLFEDVEATIEVLKELQSLGVGLHMDDFGAGYSSLSLLHRFPISAMKIDRSFISRLGMDRENLEIVRTIIHLGRSLKKEVIAEGIETREQRVQLASVGCEFGQGYLFSVPEPAAVFDATLQHEAGRQTHARRHQGVRSRQGTQPLQPPIIRSG